MADKQIAWKKWKNILKKPKPTGEDDETFGSGMTQMLFSPMGVFKVPDELVNPAKAYTFWCGHTNFRITQGTVEAIENTDGVEVFDVLSPYRFRVCIAKLFKSVEVKHDIVQRVRATEVALPINLIGDYIHGKKNSEPTEPTTE